MRAGHRMRKSSWRRYHVRALPRPHELSADTRRVGRRQIEGARGGGGREREAHVAGAVLDGEGDLGDEDDGKERQGDVGHVAHRVVGVVGPDAGRTDVDHGGRAVEVGGGARRSGGLGGPGFCEATATTSETEREQRGEARSAMRRLDALPSSGSWNARGAKGDGGAWATGSTGRWTAGGAVDRVVVVAVVFVHEVEARLLEKVGLR